VFRIKFKAYVYLFSSEVVFHITTWYFVLYGVVYYSTTLIQKIKIPRPLSQATSSNHPNAFTFTLHLSQRRAGEAWEPYKAGRTLI
jgi:hypothetical protein